MRTTRLTGSRVWTLVASIAAVLVVTSACGGGAKTSTGGRTPAGGSTVISVVNFSFGPKTLTVPVGSTVTWRFEDSARHNVTAEGKSFASKDLSGGATYSFRFNKAGTYAYLCTIHQYMTGQVIVR